MSAKDVIKDTEMKMKKTMEAIQREFSIIRTGRASTALVETLKVDYYGVSTPLRQVASITTPDARLIMIQPWDKNALFEIEKAILKSDIGINPTNDGKSIRLSMPSLTDERRAELDKVLKKIAEDGRVSLRTCRHSAVEHIRKLEKDKVITEDERFNSQEEIQKLTDKYIKDVDNLLAGKEKEIS
ncbi:MAG: ribosome recycling factor [Candidatus Omnitrophota bacterium]|nr:ribosome recycling factor [Candidatus Omnitrophota bacterium]